MTRAESPGEHLDIPFERWSYAFAIGAALLAIAQAFTVEPQWGGAPSLGVFVIAWGIRGLIRSARRPAT